MSALREGDRISNYLLEAQVGAGSFGEVWRARHHVFDEVVAVKVPTDAQYVRNLRQEGVAVHGLRHPNVVRVIDLDPYGEPPYLVMEYVDGPSLREAIDRYKGLFPIPAVVAVLRGVLLALQAAHDGGLLHCDVKPANILLGHPLDSLATISDREVKVTDFGLGQVCGNTTRSIMQSGSAMTEDGRSIAGTLAYMSPEQKEGRDLDPRSDLYACGILLFEMLTGERPQGGDAPSSIRTEVSRNLDEVVSRAYTRLERRYASASEMLRALESGERTGPPPLPQAVPASGSVAGCPSCRGAIERDDQFCIRCGHQLIARVPQCNKCQAYVHVSDRFCIMCGNDLTVLEA